MRLSLLLGTLALVALAAPPAPAALVRVGTGDHGQEGDYDAGDCLISGDGRYVFFDSCADNLVPGVTNKEDNVYERDLVTGSVRRVSVDPEGNQVGGPMDQLFHLGGVASDGHYVAMCSFYSLENDTLTPTMWWYVKDTLTGAVGTVAYEGKGVGGWFLPLSADGQCALVTGEDLVPGEGGGTADDFVLDLQAQTLDWVSVGMNGQASNGNATSSGYATMGLSADGQYAAFMSVASNLVPNGTTNPNVYLRDRAAGATYLVSATSTGTPCAGVVTTCLSPDGRYVAFTSKDQSIVSGGAGGVAGAYLWDRVTAKTERLDVSDAGEGGNADARGCYGVSAGGATSSSFPRPTISPRDSPLPRPGPSPTCTSATANSGPPAPSSSISPVIPPTSGLTTPVRPTAPSSP